MLAYIKGHNPVTNLRNMTGNNPNLDNDNMNAYTKIGEILSICKQDVERKRNSDIKQWQQLLLQICEKRQVTIPTKILSI